MQIEEGSREAGRREDGQGVAKGEIWLPLGSGRKEEVGLLLPPF